MLSKKRTGCLSKALIQIYAASPRDPKTISRRCGGAVISNLQNFGTTAGIFPTSADEKPLPNLIKIPLKISFIISECYSFREANKLLYMSTFCHKQ